ncbi:hypothetical protein COT77_00240 [Candidatus Berkelbacteria bacterium CG10_big_fil_rev_8_21_14_0_10_41_12]|uniref:PEGA domain-containing protein n=1 Tax=Candidatus Berkelbacteria bacterium CG10_big_fil_rev_8_21_14_0_10_41_12 TaxID=1974513 RepID=A0A2M6WY21_9BACT|nr:MAG: hypothetical protein COT77_00240 [Candidatus Berkelbacteria bacterium CG10_big_fil_rev_8_21_14_0_10_41_12]
MVTLGVIAYIGYRNNFWGIFASTSSPADECRIALDKDIVEDAASSSKYVYILDYNTKMGVQSNPSLMGISPVAIISNTNRSATIPASTTPYYAVIHMPQTNSSSKLVYSANITCAPGKASDYYISEANIPSGIIQIRSASGYYSPPKSNPGDSSQATQVESPKNPISDQPSLSGEQEGGVTGAGSGSGTSSEGGTTGAGSGSGTSSEGGTTAQQHNVSTVTFSVTTAGTVNTPIKDAQIALTDNGTQPQTVGITDKTGKLYTDLSKFNQLANQMNSSGKLYLIAYKPANQNTAVNMSAPLPYSTPQNLYEFRINCSSSQASDSVNYTAQAQPGQYSVPSGQNTIIFSAKRKSGGFSGNMVRIGGVNFSLVGTSSNNAKAASIDENGNQTSSSDQTSGALTSNLKKVFDSVGDLVGTNIKNSDQTDTPNISSGTIDKIKTKTQSTSAIANDYTNLKNRLSGAGSNAVNVTGMTPEGGDTSIVSIPYIPKGTYTLSLSKSGYQSKSVQFSITSDSGSINLDTNNLELAPNKGAEVPAAPASYTVSRVPGLKDNYYIATTAGDAQNPLSSVSALYYNPDTPQPGWTNQLLTKPQLDPNNPADQKTFANMVKDCVDKNPGLAAQIGISADSNLLKNLGYAYAVYELGFSNNSTSNSIKNALGGIAITQLLAKGNSGNININLDLFNQCGFSPYLFSGNGYSAYQPNYPTNQYQYPYGQTSAYNGYPTLQQCKTAYYTRYASSLVPNQQQLQLLQICPQLYGPTYYLPNTGTYGTYSPYQPYTPPSTLGYALGALGTVMSFK